MGRGNAGSVGPGTGVGKGSGSGEGSLGSSGPLGGISGCGGCGVGCSGSGGLRSGRRGSLRGAFMAHFADFVGVVSLGLVSQFSRHPLHLAAAAATQGMCHGNTHERLSGDFYFAQALGIHASVVLIPSHALLFS
jgi:hypothetical protein